MHHIGKFYASAPTPVSHPMQAQSSAMEWHSSGSSPMFFVLAQFDARKGHHVVWTSDIEQLKKVPLVEFKMIPSGMHERDKDAVYFTCGMCHGVARYACRGRGSRTRQDVYMYSLAVLAPLGTPLPWSQESMLKVALAKFLTSGLDSSTLPKQPLSRPDPRTHPILAMGAYLRVYGASVFAIWKAVLSRARLLLAPISGASMRTMCRFTYIASQLGAVPADVQHLLPKRKPPVQCLYGVVLADLPKLQISESFVATTTDTVLFDRSRDACDSFAEPTHLVDLAQKVNVRSTYRERHRARMLFSMLKISTNACATCANGNGVGYSGCNCGSNELNHKRDKSSALEYLSASLDSAADLCVNGFVWWASGGESAFLSRDECLQQASESALEPGADVVAALGCFQEYTRQLVRGFARAYIDDEAVVQLTLPDIAAMGLDPFSNADRVFLNRFGLAWFDRPVVFGCCH